MARPIGRVSNGAGRSAWRCTAPPRGHNTLGGLYARERPHSIRNRGLNGPLNLIFRVVRGRLSPLSATKKFPSRASGNAFNPHLYPRDHSIHGQSQRLSRAIPVLLRGHNPQVSTQTARRRSNRLSSLSSLSSHFFARPKFRWAVRAHWMMLPVWFYSMFWRCFGHHGCYADSR